MKMIAKRIANGTHTHQKERANRNHTKKNLFRFALAQESLSDDFWQIRYTCLLSFLLSQNFVFNAPKSKDRIIEGKKRLLFDYNRLNFFHLFGIHFIHSSIKICSNKKQTYRRTYTHACATRSRKADDDDVDIKSVIFHIFFVIFIRWKKYCCVFFESVVYLIVFFFVFLCCWCSVNEDVLRYVIAASVLHFYLFSFMHSKSLKILLQ